jgi:hypothetical protein
MAEELEGRTKEWASPMTISPTVLRFMKSYDVWESLIGQEDIWIWLCHNFNKLRGADDFFRKWLFLS